jgi:transcriptional regulator with XRE-family HTH domain
MPRRPHDPALLVSLGSRLRELREAAGLTQQKLADAVRVEPKTISMFESGGFAPTVTTASVIAQVLKVKLSDIFEGVGAPARAEPSEPEEAELLEGYRALSEEKKRVVRELMRVL